MVPWWEISPWWLLTKRGSKSTLMRVWLVVQLIARRLLLKVGVTMPLMTTPHETSCLLGLKRKSGSIRATAISRLYPGKCPFEIGAQVSLATDVAGKGKIYAGCIMRGIVDMSFARRSEDSELSNRLAGAEGFQNARSWGIHFRSMFPHVKATSLVTRIQLDQMRVLGEAQPGAPGQPQREMASDEVRSMGTVASLDDIGA